MIEVVAPISQTVELPETVETPSIQGNQLTLRVLYGKTDTASLYVSEGLLEHLYELRDRFKLVLNDPEVSVLYCYLGALPVKVGDRISYYHSYLGVTYKSAYLLVESPDWLGFATLPTD